MLAWSPQARIQDGMEDRKRRERGELALPTPVCSSIKLWKAQETCTQTSPSRLLKRCSCEVTRIEHILFQIGYIKYCWIFFQNCCTYFDFYEFTCVSISPHIHQHLILCTFQNVLNIKTFAVWSPFVLLIYFSWMLGVGLMMINATHWLVTNITNSTNFNNFYASLIL